MVLESINGLFNAIKELLTTFFYVFKNLLNSISSFIVEKLDVTIVNGDYYKYFIGFMLIVLYCLFYYVIYSVNLLKIANTKYSHLLNILFVSVLVIIYFFFIHRNDPISSKNNTIMESRKTIKNLNEDENTNNYLKFLLHNKTNTKNEETNKQDNVGYSIVDPLRKLFKALSLLIVIIVVPLIIIAFILTAIHNVNESYYIIQLLIGIFLIISSLAIVAKLFSVQAEQPCYDEKDSSTFSTFLCTLKNLIFFIPCLLIIVIDYLKTELKLTPPSVYILFILEIVLVLLLFLVPILFNYLSNMNGNNLLHNKGNVLYLNEFKTIGTYQILNKPEKDTNKRNIFSLFEKSKNQDYNLEVEFGGKGKMPRNHQTYSYSVSFYLYLNPQPNNTSLAYNQDTELFSYGKKPVIYYNGKTQNIIIKSNTLKNNSNNNGELVTIFDSKDSSNNSIDNSTIKFQKWQYYVINYSNNTIDIFIDGKLVGSKNNVPPYLDEDKVTIGDPDFKKDGIHGSIKELYYYDKIRPQNTIEFIHDLTKNNE